MPAFASYAKINLGLKITGQRPDGYHTIQTVFQEVSLADTIVLEPTVEGWSFTCDSDSVSADETNLCVRAFLTLKELFPALGGVRIHLQKRIPVGAGLGGGSSNAATVLKGINKLYNLRLNEGRLEEIGLFLGADVPFFIRGGSQYAEGIGEILSPCTPPFRTISSSEAAARAIGTILIATPDIHISTKWAYSEVKNYLIDINNGGKFAATFESEDSWQLFENDFESLVFQTYPEIGSIKQQLLKSGAVFASLSGSGSTVFGIFRDEVQVQEAQHVISSHVQTFTVHPILK